MIGTELVPEKAAKARAQPRSARLAAMSRFERAMRARRCGISIGRSTSFCSMASLAVAFEILQIIEPKLVDGAIVVVDNIAHFRSDLRRSVERLSRAPYRSTRLPFKSGTLVGVNGGV